MIHCVVAKLVVDHESVIGMDRNVVSGTCVFAFNLKRKLPEHLCFVVTEHIGHQVSPSLFGSFVHPKLIVLDVRQRTCFHGVV